MRIIATTAAVFAVLTAQAIPAFSDELADLKAARAEIGAAFGDQDADTLRSLMTADHIARPMSMAVRLAWTSRSPPCQT